MRTLHHTGVTTPSRTRRPARRAVAVSSAVAVAVSIWGLARMLGIEVLAPEMGGDPATDITALEVIVASGVVSTAGWALLEGLERLITRSRQVWLVIAAILQLASLVAPLGGAGITTANQVVLVLLHLGVAGVLVPGLLGVWTAVPSPPSAGVAQVPETDMMG